MRGVRVHQIRSGVEGRCRVKSDERQAWQAMLGALFLDEMAAARTMGPRSAWNRGVELVADLYEREGWASGVNGSARAFMCGVLSEAFCTLLGLGEDATDADRAFASSLGTALDAYRATLGPMDDGPRLSSPGGQS